MKWQNVNRDYAFFPLYPWASPYSTSPIETRRRDTPILQDKGQVHPPFLAALAHADQGQLLRVRSCQLPIHPTAHWHPERSEMQCLVKVIQSQGLRPAISLRKVSRVQRSWATGQRMQWYDGSTFDDAQNYVIASTHKKYRRAMLGTFENWRNPHWSIEGWSFHVIDDSNPRGSWSKLHVSVLLQDHNSPIFSPIKNPLTYKTEIMKGWIGTITFCQLLFLHAVQGMGHRGIHAALCWVHRKGQKQHLHHLLPETVSGRKPPSCNIALTTKKWTSCAGFGQK